MRNRSTGRRSAALLAALALGSAGALMVAPTAQAAGAALSKPGQCAATTTGVKVAVSETPTTVAVTNTMGSTVNVTVSVPSADKSTTFALTAANSFWRLSDATWCVTSSGASTSGTGLTGSGPTTGKHAAAHQIRYVTLYSVTATHLLGSTATCYHQTPFGYDISWNGVVGTTDNAVGYDTTEGTCDGHPFPVTLVLGDTEKAALANCTALYPGYEQLLRVWNTKQAGYTTSPANLWVCTDQV